MGRGPIAGLCDITWITVAGWVGEGRGGCLSVRRAGRKPSIEGLGRRLAVSWYKLHLTGGHFVPEVALVQDGEADTAGDEAGTLLAALAAQVGAIAASNMEASDEPDWI